MSRIGNKTHVMRIMNDFREFYEQNPEGIFIVPEEDDICKVHALIIGPPETPYENGFFYFVLKYVTSILFIEFLD